MCFEQRKIYADSNCTSCCWADVRGRRALVAPDTVGSSRWLVVVFRGTHIAQMRAH